MSSLMVLLCARPAALCRFARWLRVEQIPTLVNGELELPVQFELAQRVVVKLLELQP